MDPFEKLFGDTSELRVIQFLLPTRRMSFNITEIAQGANISRQAAIPVVKKFLKWKILKSDCKHGNAHYYTVDENSGFIEAFENLNNRIIEQMLREEMRQPGYFDEIGEIVKQHEHDEASSKTGV